MKLRPLHDWAIIRRVASAEKTSGGIIIPEAAKEKPAEGIIEAIGPGRYKKEPGKKGRYVPTVLKPGQHILFTDYMAKDVEIEGNEYTFIREEDVLGLVEQTGAVALKKDHPVAEKKDQPVMVQAKPQTAEKSAPAAEKKPAPKKKAPVKKAAAAPKKKAAAKKSTAGKKAEKKAAPKKPAKKKAKAPAKKAAAGKAKTKKSATVKKSPKKAAPKKAAAKKPVKKSTAESRKKTRK